MDLDSLINTVLERRPKPKKDFKKILFEGLSHITGYHGPVQTDKLRSVLDSAFMFIIANYEHYT